MQSKIFFCKFKVYFLFINKLSVIDLTIEMLAIWNIFKINVTILLIFSNWKSMHEDFDNNALQLTWLHTSYKAEV